MANKQPVVITINMERVSGKTITESQTNELRTLLEKLGYAYIQIYDNTPCE